MDDGRLGCFQLGAIVKDAAVGIHVQAFVGTSVLFFSSAYLGVVLLDNMAQVCLTA